MDLFGSRILIVDPDPDVSRTLERYFIANDHRVRLLDQAGDLLKVARQDQPNAILLSTELNDYDPYLICQVLIEDKLTSHIPVIMILHLDERSVRLKALEAGADNVVTKPIDIEELRLRVEASIRLSTLQVYA